MSYQREGSLKISNHHVRSPLLNINRACQTCHKWSEDELRDRVHSIQDRTFQFIEAENSMGFHAPQEAMRVLALSLDHARKGQLALRPR
jgi:nitrite reductase (cytochrome c-552)